MNLFAKTLRSLLALGFVAFGATACFGDPAGPGATGKIQLGQGIVTDNITTMFIQVVPDDAQKPFDPKAPGFPDSANTDVPTWGRQAVDFATVKFPYTYTVSDALGTTPHKHWRIFVWLSKTSDEVAPTTGEAFGTNTFQIKSCEQYGDFCTVTSDVNVAIDKITP